MSALSYRSFLVERENLSVSIEISISSWNIFEIVYAPAVPMRAGLLRNRYLSRPVSDCTRDVNEVELLSAGLKTLFGRRKTKLSLRSFRRKGST